MRCWKTPPAEKTRRIEIDLENQKIVRPDGEERTFDVDPFRKHCLLEGLDDIGITLQSDDRIDSFEERQRCNRCRGSGRAGLNR